MTVGTSAGKVTVYLLLFAMSWINPPHTGATPLRHIPNSETTPASPDIRILEAAPYFHPFKAWKECVSTLASVSLQSGKQAAETTDFSLGACMDEERELRSIVARDFGIAGADYIIARLRSNQRSADAKMFQQAHPVIEGLYAQFLGWTIKKQSLQSCSAMRQKQDLIDPLVVAILRENNNQFMAIVVGGQASANNSDLLAGARTQRTFILSGANRSSGRHLVIPFDVLRDDGNLVIKITLDQSLINKLAPYSHVQIDNPDISKNIVFDLPGIEQVWYKLLECTG